MWPAPQLPLLRPPLPPNPSPLNAHTHCSGELYPVETDVRLCEELETGREVEVDMVNDVLTDLTTGKKYSLKPLGDVSGAAALWHPPPSRVCHLPDQRIVLLVFAVGMQLEGERC